MMKSEETLALSYHLISMAFEGCIGLVNDKMSNLLNYELINFLRGLIS